MSKNIEQRTFGLQMRKRKLYYLCKVCHQGSPARTYGSQK